MQAGAYRLEGEIGHGGMGVVFRGHDPDFGRSLAVKVLLSCHQGRPELERRASLCDNDALAKLPEAERAAFVKLWADVASLKKARK